MTEQFEDEVQKAVKSKLANSHHSARLILALIRAWGPKIEILAQRLVRDLPKYDEENSHKNDQQYIDFLNAELIIKLPGQPRFLLTGQPQFLLTGHTLQDEWIEFNVWEISSTEDEGIVYVGDKAVKADTIKYQPLA